MRLRECCCPTTCSQQIIHLVTSEQFRLPIPDDVPPPVADLMRQCWAENPADRWAGGGRRVHQVTSRAMHICLRA